MVLATPYTFAVCRHKGCTYTYRVELTAGGVQQMVAYVIAHMVCHHWDMLMLNRRIVLDQVTADDVDAILEEIADVRV